MENNTRAEIMSALWESSESVISRFSPPSYKDFLQYFSSLTSVERRVATETLWNGHYAEERYIRSTTGTSAMRQNFYGARGESADSGIQSESASVGINRRIYGRNAFQGCGSYYSARGHTTSELGPRQRSVLRRLLGSPV